MVMVVYVIINLPLSQLTSPTLPYLFLDIIIIIFWTKGEGNQCNYLLSIKKKKIKTFLANPTFRYLDFKN